MKKLRSRSALGRLAVGTAAAGLLVGLVAPTSASAVGAIELQPTDTHQTIEGFGYSIAFSRAQLVENLPAAQRTAVLDLLLDPDSGAAPDILRLLIASGQYGSIQGTDPGGPDAEPQYRFDGDDAGQVWFSKEAQARGLQHFYANAWSAPAYMKDNNDQANGGQLCGVPGAGDCGGEDWRTAYANHLVAFADFYAAEGIPISDIGFTNEPDYAPGYSSMEFTPEQAADMVAIAAPIAAQAGYGLTCCDAFGWNQGEAYRDALRASGGLSQLSAFTSHSYTSRSDDPLGIDETSVWQSEWAPSSVNDGWNTAWDSATAKVTDGFAIAEHIHDSLALADVSAYLYWYGVSQGGTAALVQVTPDTNSYDVSSRLYAFAAYSRHIDVGAQRFTVTSPSADLKISAYTNPDGSQVTQILNLSHEAISTSINARGHLKTYLTDETHDLQLVDTVSQDQGTTTALQLPARSLVTLVDVP